MKTEIAYSNTKTIMLIEILDDTIETKNIYLIGPITGNEFYWQFVIKFFNDKNITIQCPYYADMPNNFHLCELEREPDETDEQYIKRKLLEWQIKKKTLEDINKSKISSLRETVESYWNEDKSTIPQINF